MIEGTDRGQQNRIAALDLLRLVAALWVVGWHFSISGVFIKQYIDFRTPLLEPVSQYGFLGVQVFFVISGFVISMSLQGRTAVEFVVARLIRLFPAYWLCMAITLLALYLRGNGQFACDGTCLALNTFMLNSFFDYPYLDPSYWSLAVELQFYLMMAAMVLLRWSRHLLEIMLLWLLISSAPMWRVQPPGMDTVFYATAAMWAPYFACGTALFLIWRDGVRLKYLLVLALAWLLCTHYIGVDVDSVKPVAVPGRPFSVVAGIALFTAFLLLILLISLRRIAIKPSALTRFAGGTSYPLYLLHEVVGFTLLNRFKGSLPDWALMTGTIVLMLLGAVLVWRYAEAPLQRRLRSLVRSAGIGTGPTS